MTGTTSGKRGSGKASGLLFFAGAVLALVLFIKALNWLPEALQGGSVRRYGSIEEAEKKLGIGRIYVPAYFPEGYGWPPSVIAQERPFKAVMVEFAESEGGGPALLICQSESGGFLPGGRMAVKDVRETSSYDLKGRRAVLEVGSCGDGSPCSGIRWDEGGYTVRMVARAAPFELIRIADSMVR